MLRRLDLRVAAGQVHGGEFVHGVVGVFVNASRPRCEVMPRSFLPSVFPSFLLSHFNADHCIRTTLTHFKRVLDFRQVLTEAGLSVVPSGVKPVRCLSSRSSDTKKRSPGLVLFLFFFF